MDLDKYYNNLTELPVEDIQYLVIHHSATSPDVSIEDIHQMHLNEGFTCVGYHCFIKADGTIQWGRLMDSQGAQSYGFNHCSLGVCLAGYFHRDNINKGQWSDKPTDAQLKSLLEVLVNWKKKIPQQVKIVGHRELCPTSCPGDGFSHLMLQGISLKVDALLKGKPEIKPVEKKIPYQDLIKKYSKEKNLRFSFVAGLIEKESSFNPRAVSINDAKGLMQAKQGTFNQYSSGDIFDPENNIRAGCSYLSWLKTHFGIDQADNSKSVELLISGAYNQGQNSPTFQYAKKVQELSLKYKE